MKTKTKTFARKKLQVIFLNDESKSKANVGDFS